MALVADFLVFSLLTTYLETSAYTQHYLKHPLKSWKICVLYVFNNCANIFHPESRSLLQCSKISALQNRLF